MSYSNCFKRLAILVTLLFTASVGYCDDYLSGKQTRLFLKHQQQWGTIGWDTAVVSPGGQGKPLRIGKQTYKNGLGLHANGDIVVDLKGQFSEFRCLIGVQWQGGNKGSVVFKIAVDGKDVFESKPMCDSDPALEVQIPLDNAHELRLIATDAEDGIGCDAANWVEARLIPDPNRIIFGATSTTFAGNPAPLLSDQSCGFFLIAKGTGPQVAFMEPIQRLCLSVQENEEVRFVTPIKNISESLQLTAQVALTYGKQAEVELVIDGKRITKTIHANKPITLKVDCDGSKKTSSIEIITRGIDEEAAVRWQNLQCTTKGRSFKIPFLFSKEKKQFPPISLPPLRPSIEQELVEWDWRMQDGIGTEREPRTWQQAIQKVIKQGDQLIKNLKTSGVMLTNATQTWEELRKEHKTLLADSTANDLQWENLWRRVHNTRRRIVFANPLADVGPLIFIKRVPSCFSHQLTQYSGMCARPGGGLFVLDAPGKSMQTRQFASALPTGSYQHLDVSWDGKRILFGFCEVDSVPPNRYSRTEQNYHLFEVSSDGSGLKQMTEGPYDDFSPRYLPNGKILFLSTRRGGYHRCGKGPCPVHAMAIANADGSNPQVISFHETHEWDPAVLNDGRIIYTRWDYVDRHAVHYQQLWSVRPDGSDVRAFYGNNTFNPVGVWEARPVPGSNLVMATAGAHHAMTAGSIITLDVSQAMDGAKPISRLTPDALFPESESRVQRWHAPAGITSAPIVPVEEKRWPGHCYRTPYPLSENYFLASYSFDPLIGEPQANPANMFGLYLIDRFGNKELIYRDVNIASLWPMPMRARSRPPVLASTLQKTDQEEGTFFVQNIQESWPVLPKDDVIKELRILQILMKTTPDSNSPKVGAANASPGKQVLGTIPVEADGSAYFRAPAKTPLLFQALNEQGMAVQTMRSLTYLQPGEHATCIGCHQYRNRVPSPRLSAMARKRPPSVIAEGPDGSKPLSYPILVQPVLDKHCTSCHQGKDAAGNIQLTGQPQGSFTASYNSLVPFVSYSQWKATPQANDEPLTKPGLFGARASKLTKLLLEGHEGVELSNQDMQRLITWMDANALFYGTFNVDDQKRQLLGERIAEPALK